MLKNRSHQNSLTSLASAIAAVSVLCLWCSVPAWANDADEIAEAFAATYKNLPYRNASIFVDDCQISIRVETLSNCTDPVQAAAYSYFVDLKHNAPRTGRDRPRIDGDMWALSVRFERFGTWIDESRRINRRSDEILAAARREMGWGPDAAYAAASQFLREVDIEDIRDWESREYCSGGVTFMPSLRRLRLRSPDLNPATDALARYSNECGASQ
ncbi:MAG: hypothetical protein AAGI36_04930 [Pseudomonadota bacterium]